MTEKSRSAFARPGSEMAARIEAFDWASTAIGPIDGWPTALKVTVGIMVHSAFPKCIVWGPELVLLYNDAFKPILGAKPDALGRSFRDVWSEAWEAIEPIVERARQGESTFIEDFPLVINRFGYPEQCYFTFCYSPILDENGRIAGMLDTVIETTGKVESERQATVRNAELAHRIRNTLTMVSAIASQTLKGGIPLDAAAQNFSQRLHALAETHNLLTQTAKPSALIDDIVRAALEPHMPVADCCDLSGPPINLPERQALSLALAVNELATNAVKHGSLSKEGGKASVYWAVRHNATDGHFFYFHWTERGGPLGAAPTSKGFGTRLLETVIPADFGGHAKLIYAPEGFQYTLIGNFQRVDEAAAAG